MKTQITLNLICVVIAFAIGFIVLRIVPRSSPFSLNMLCVVCSVWAYQTLIRLPKMAAKPGNYAVRYCNLLGSRISGFHGAAGVHPAVTTYSNLTALCNKESCKQLNSPYLCIAAGIPDDASR